MTRLGELLARYRQALGLRTVEVARRAGYRNTNKGIRRYLQIESGREVFPDMRVLTRFTAALGIDSTEVLQATSEDFCKLDKPVPPHAIVRLMPAIYVPIRLPDGCSTERAEAIAAEYAKTTGRSVWLALSQVRGVYFYPDGTRAECYGTPMSTFCPPQALLRHRSVKEAFSLARSVGKVRMEGGRGHGDPVGAQ